jgi:hypothetical protein
MEIRLPSKPEARNALTALIVVALFTLVACGGGVGTSDQQVSPGGASPPPSPGPGAPPTMSFNASPTLVNNNGSTTLTWSSSNASSCSASGGWSGTKALSGSQLITALTSSATFSLGCTGTGGTVNRSVTVTVSASFIVDAAWAPNPDNPDGYLVYIGPTAGSASTLVKTLAKGAADWSPTSPSTQLASNDVQAVLGTATQVCVAVRAFNAGGVSLPSPVTCVALP